MMFWICCISFSSSAFSALSLAFSSIISSNWRCFLFLQRFWAALFASLCLWTSIVPLLVAPTAFVMDFLGPISSPWLPFNNFSIGTSLIPVGSSLTRFSLIFVLLMAGALLFDGSASTITNELPSVREFTDPNSTLLFSEFAWKWVQICGVWRLSSEDWAGTCNVTDKEFEFLMAFLNSSSKGLTCWRSWNKPTSSQFRINLVGVGVSP